MEEIKKLEDRIMEVIKDYAGFPKIRSDKGEFVIIAESDKGDSYEENKECLGVDAEGNLIWSYLSGCSCNGYNDNEKVSDITAKIFKIEKNDTAESFYENNACEPYQGSYESY